MAQQVPTPTTLGDAVVEVISQNTCIGYTPTRFIQMTEGGNADNLVEICNRLIQSGATYEAVSNQLNSHPDILTLEDLIVHSPHGRKWGLSESTIETAKARVEAWDNEVGMQRWLPPPGVGPDLV